MPCSCRSHVGTFAAAYPYISVSSISWVSLVEICHMSHLLVVPPPLSESHRSPVLDHQASPHQTFLPQCLLTLLFPSVIQQELTARERGVGICVSRCEMSAGYPEKYPGTVPSAQSHVWMMSPLLHWLEKQTPWEP